MKATRLFVVPFCLALMFVTSCHRAPDAGAESEGVAVPQFSAKKGLLLPEQTRRSLGLNLIEVSERSVTTLLELPVRIYRLDGERARASGMVTLDQSKLLKEGQHVKLRAADGGSFDGKIVGWSEQLQKATGMVEVLVEIAGKSESLTPGAFLEANVMLDAGRSVVTIPRSALLGCSEGQFVYTVSGEHLVRTAVKAGASDTDFIEITDGLYAGDQVVLRPVMSLWLTELAAVKGGQACCIEPPKGK